MKSASTWRRAPLESVAELCLGKMLDQRKNRGDFMPYLANINVRWGEIELKNLRSMRFESHELDRYGLQFGDIVMCEGGEPGRCAIWRDQLPGMMIQKALHRIRSTEALDHRFLFYQLLNTGQRRGFDRYFTGSTIKHLPGDKLANVEVVVPPISTQRRIADILSAYDDLIENCQRRIELLEQMARALYREWFVKFRYPGHESVPLVSSPLGDIPQGWEVKELGEVAEVLRGRSYRSADLTEDGGLPFLNLKCLDRDGGFRRSGLKRYRGDFKPAHVVRKGDIVMAVTDMTQERRIVARAALVPPLATDFGVFSMDLVRIEVKTDLPKIFIYAFLRHSKFADEVKNYANGANVLHLSPDRITRYRLAIPSTKLLTSFASIVEPLIEQSNTLESTIDNARRTRDLLLPRLISGQLEVDAA